MGCRTRDIHEVLLASPLLLVKKKNALSNPLKSGTLNSKTFQTEATPASRRGLHLASGGGVENEDVNEDAVGFERVKKARRVGEVGDVANHGEDGPNL